MSVPVSKRGKSKLEFFHQAYKLNDEITKLLLRDFGLKTINSDLNVFTYRAKMSEEDKQIFTDLVNRYHLNVETAYPYWLIDYYRNWILHILEQLINNITTANTIYANSEKEFYDRRHYQWLAISNCQQLFQTMQAVIRNLPVNAEKYMRYVDIINNEIDSLKEWKKSDNKILTAIRNKTKTNSDDTTNNSID